MRWLSVARPRRPKAGLGHASADGDPQDPNQRWSLDFVSDTLADGRRFRILCIIDDFSRECLASVVDNSISGERVARELDAIADTSLVMPGGAGFDTDQAWWQRRKECGDIVSTQLPTHKRLDEGQFCWPRIGASRVRLNHAVL